MFHRNAVFINSALMVLCVTSYFSPNVNEFKFSHMLLILSFLILLLLFSFLYVFISSLIIEVGIGKPPFAGLEIAYKYALSNELNTSAIFIVDEVFPKHDKVQICYERRGGPFGIAYGAVIPNVKEHTNVLLNGFRTFQTRGIANAVYISCPTLPWLSYLGIWLILRIAYPKIYRYSKKHKLSAYPVVELYRRFSVTLMAPLSQQDSFVVPEAESIVQRSSTSFNSVFSSTSSNCSNRHSKSLSRDSQNSLNEVDIDFNKLNSTQISTPKILNGNFKQG